MRMGVAALLAMALAGCATQASGPVPVAAVGTTPVRATAPAIERSRDEQQVLFWSQPERFERFQAMEDWFRGIEVAPPSAPRPLPSGAPLPADLSAALDAAFVEAGAVGLMVLKDGRVRYARYAPGYGPERRWTSFSVAKSFTATLLGAALGDGAITGLDDPVTRYLPELSGTAYEGVTVGEVAGMRSGVAWREIYDDPTSDVARMLETVPNEGEPQSVAYARTLARAEPLGEGRWRYNTLETNLLGDIVAAATGESLASYAKRKIVDPAGFEAPLFWMIDESGRNIGGCCLSLRLADYARFGQFALDGGAGTVPAAWFAEAGAARSPFADRPGFGYGNQWWTYPGGAYGAQGIFGQGVTIDPGSRTVVAVVGNRERATGGPGRDALALLMRRIAEAK